MVRFTSEIVSQIGEIGVNDHGRVKLDWLADPRGFCLKSNPPPAAFNVFNAIGRRVVNGRAQHSGWAWEPPAGAKPEAAPEWSLSPEGSSSTGSVCGGGSLFCCG